MGAGLYHGDDRGSRQSGREDADAAARSRNTAGRYSQMRYRRFRGFGMSTAHQTYTASLAAADEAHKERMKKRWVLVLLLC
jgi:hypothetical protein